MAAQLQAHLDAKNLEIDRAKEVLTNLEDELRFREAHKKAWKEQIMLKMVVAFYERDIDRQKKLSKRLDSRCKVKKLCFRFLISLTCNVTFTNDVHLYLGVQYPAS